MRWSRSTRNGGWAGQRRDAGPKESWGKVAQACPGIGLLFGGGQAVVADAADFGAGDGNLHFKVAGDLFLQLLVETGFEFTDLAAAKTRDMDMIAGAMGFVVVAIAPQVQKVEFIDEAFFLEQVDSAVDGDEMNVGIDFLGAGEDLVDIEVLLGVVHDFENHAALARQANSLLAQCLLEVAGGFRGVDALTGRDAMRRGGRHERVPKPILSRKTMASGWRATSSLAGGETGQIGQVQGSCKAPRVLPASCADLPPR